MLIATLPSDLIQRPAVRRIRKVGAPQPSLRTQPMAGFDDRFTDIVDYIVRITDEIWQDRTIGLIYDTYDPDCVVYTSYGVVRGADTVVRNTTAAIAAAPDGITHHLNVAWTGGEQQGFYTAHLGYDEATDRTSGLYGPPTGRRYLVRFAADCISHGNKIHTEWLVRDNGAVVRQLGLDRDMVARQLAERPQTEPYVVETGTGLSDPGQAGPFDQWVTALFDGIYNRRRLDLLQGFYAPHVIVHTGGGRTLQGLAAFSDFILLLLASLPDGTMQVEHICWSEETDGTILAVRWVLSGSTAQGGLLGRSLPAGRSVFMMGCSHLRLDCGRIVEEWTVFDEIAVLAMAYRS